MSKILIVEDEESIAELEKDYLELSGFEVEIENDGAEGLEKALKGDFDLFILDLMLPGTDGFEICKRIREVKNTPIIMISASRGPTPKTTLCRVSARAHFWQLLQVCSRVSQSIIAIASSAFPPDWGIFLYLKVYHGLPAGGRETCGQLPKQEGSAGKEKKTVRKWMTMETNFWEKCA